MSLEQQPDNSLFENIVLEAGLRLEGSTVGIHELVVEPSIFRQKIIQKIKCHSQYPDPAIEIFLEELQNYLDIDTEKFKACLQPLSVKGQSIYGSTADSFVRILLSIDFFQANLIDQLLERLPTFISDSDNDIIESPIPRLILQQLKWLDNIVNPTRITEKILEMIPITPLGIQREIITSLPDIINDSEQKIIVKELTELIEQNHRLIVPILDALPHFTLQEDLMTNIQNTVFSRLESADLDDLPIIVKFLLQTSSPNDAENVIRQIRKKVDFHSIGKLQNELKNSKLHQKKKKELMPEALILDSIKKGINIHKFVTNAWLKEINDVELEKDHRIIDILTLFLLHSIPSLKKKVEAIFCKKILNGLFSKNLLEETIKYHFEGLRDYFDDILIISESLLRTSQHQTIVARAACTLYRSAFMVFELYQQQEIIASLVSHIGSGSPTEIESTLSVLSHLVDVDIKKLSQFAIFVKGLLDYLDNLNLDQIRILFDIIGKLVYEDANYDSNSGGLLAEFSIVIQKQLSNPNEKYKQIGVIGALALVRILGSKPTLEEYTSNTFSEIAKENIIKIERHCSRSMTCLAFAYDELAYYISTGILNPELVNWISEKIESQFADTFIVDEDDIAKFTEDEYHLKGIPIETWMECEIDCDVEEKLNVNIYPMLCEAYVPANLRTQYSVKRDYIICCCSMMKLMQAGLKFKESGNLYSIGVLLAAGLLMYKNVDAQEMKSNDYSKEMRESICNSLFYCINWCREIVSDFWGQDKEICKNVFMRLRHIIELEKRLNSMLEITPSFQPVKSKPVNISSGTMQRSFVKSGRTVRRSVVSKNKILSARRAVDADKNEENKVSEDLPKFSSVTDLRPLMRELDLSVFGMLEYFEFKKSSDDNEEPKMDADTDIKLLPDEIVYLLDDLNRKLEFKLPPPILPLVSRKVKKNEYGNKQEGFALISRMNSVDFVTKVATEFVPHLLSQLESICDELNSDNDIVMEETEHAALLRCLELILEIFRRLISWSELKSPDYKETLIIIMNQLGSRTQSSNCMPLPDSLDNLQQSADNAFQFFQDFASRLPTVGLAILFHKILIKITELSPESSKLIAMSGEIARGFASRQWNDSKKLNSDSIIYLVQKDIKHSSNPIERIMSYASDIFSSIESHDDDITETYPLFNRETFPHFYKALFIELVEMLRDFRPENFDYTADVMTYITHTIDCFQKLVSFIKINHKRVVLSVSLKHGRNFIDLFLRKMLPLMDKNFSFYREEILSIIKNFQISTRSLQALCNHVKVHKESQLAAMVPLVKRSLEIVIFQVKAMIQNNGCPPDTFFLGELKNRDIEGREITTYQNDDLSSTQNEGYNSENDKSSINNKESIKDVSETPDARSKNKSETPEEDDDDMEVESSHEIDDEEDNEERDSSCKKRKSDETDEDNEPDESIRNGKKPRVSVSKLSVSSSKKPIKRLTVKRYLR
ncbi:7516_t:CDS:10 [Diversispora eburnea]|uniref:7516_t:CDS:1 n=1 Tax=Diversispora eburnea TaxID=1213867 RepID=A0A9N8V5J9_9GLOM|nr:7516_t:CDS:10 [Diversispora eburnea]